MSDETNAVPETLKQLFTIRPGSNKKGEVAVGALQFTELPKLRLTVITIRWGGIVQARMKLIAEMALQGGNDAGFSLPYASLRAALQVKHRDAVHVDSECGAPWSDKVRPILSTTAGKSDAIDGVRMATQTWVDLVLAKWADRVGVDEALIESLRDAISESGAFGATTEKLSNDDIDPADFQVVKEYLLRIVAGRLGGEELFEGAGPVARVIRSRVNSNLLEFQTWPLEYGGAAYSMVAYVSLETMPGKTLPYLKIKASRRRWINELPEPGRLGGNGFRKIHPHIMTKDCQEIAVTTQIPLRRGEPEDVLEPACILHGLQSLYAMPKGELREQIVATAGGIGEVFVGIPHAAAFGGHKIGTGAAVLDNLDLVKKVQDQLGGLSLEPLAFESIGKSVKKDTEPHSKLGADALAHFVAGSLENPDEEFDEETAIELLKEKLPTGTFSLSNNGATELQKLQVMRDVNAVRISETYMHRPVISIVAGKKEERDLLELAIECIFGKAVKIGTGFGLPSRAHGPKSDFPDAKNVNDRFKRRYEVWEPVARQVKSQANHGVHVLVQAADWHQRDGSDKYLRDDETCKAAGRAAFAIEADSNSQWLLPLDARRRDGLKDYLYRVQAAVYDLLLGHSGCIDPIDEILEEAFEEEAVRPKCVIGISVIKLAQMKRGRGKGGTLAVAFRSEPGRRGTLARAIWKGAAPTRGGEWKPLNEFLTDIALYPGMSIGDTRDEERVVFQQFVKDIIDESADNGECPVVMIDATNARALWPSLTNNMLLDGLEFQSLPDGIVDGVAWRNVRIVRVDRNAAGFIGESKTRIFDEIDPFNDWEKTGAEISVAGATVSEELLKLDSWIDGGLYWATGGKATVKTKSRIDRSAFRDRTNMIRVKSETLREVFGDSPKGPIYRMSISDNAMRTEPTPTPSVLEIAVMKKAAEDDEDVIADFVDSLRIGYGHHENMTSLPAPISFDKKVCDYIARYLLKDDEPADDPEPDPDEDSGGLDSEQDDEQDDDEGGVRSWNADFMSKLRSSSSLTSLMSFEGIAKGETDRMTKDGRSSREHRTNQVTKRGEEERPLESAESEMAKTRISKLPSFVNDEWVAKYIYAPDKFKNIARLEAERLAAMSGYDGWPTDKKAHGRNKSIPYIIEGLHFPMFLAAFYGLSINKFKLLATPEREEKFGRELVGGVAREAQCYFDDDAKSGDEFLKGAISNALQDGNEAMALTMAFHNVVFPTLKRDHAAYRAFLVGLRDLVSKPEDVDLIVQYFDQREDSSAELDHILEHSNYWEDGESANATEEDDAIGQMEEGAIGKWRKAVDRLKIIATGLEEPSEEGVGRLRDIVEEIEDAFLEIEHEPTALNISTFNDRLIECRNRLVEIASKRLTDAWKKTADAVDTLPSEISKNIDATILEANVNAVEERFESVKDADLARKEAHQIEDEIEREKALPEAVSFFTVVLGAAFEDLEEAIKFILSNTVEEDTFRGEQDIYEQNEEVIELREDTIFDDELDDELDDEDLIEAEPDKGLEGDVGNNVDGDSGKIDRDELATEGDESFEVTDDDLMLELQQAEKDQLEAKRQNAAINDCLDDLFSRSEFGLAYHLVIASQHEHPHFEFNYTPDELLLAACANFTQAVSFNDAERYADAMSGAMQAATDLAASEDSERVAARRIALFASTIELALFSGLANSSSVSITTTLKNGVGNCFFGLSEVVKENEKNQFALTASGLFALASPEDKSYANELARSIKGKLDVIEQSQRHYKVGRQVQNWLIKKGPLKEIKNAIEGAGDSLKRAKRAKFIASKYTGKLEADELIQTAEGEEETYTQIVGEGRVWFTNNIREICKQTVEWADIIIREVPENYDEAVLKRLSNKIKKATEEASEELDDLVAKHGRLVAAAAGVAKTVLTRLQGMASGTVPPKSNPTRAMVALHAPLLWIPRLTYAGEWVPSPYQADVLQSSIVAGKVSYREDRRSKEGIVGAIKARMDEGSFNAARLLVETAQWYGFGDAEISQIRSIIDQDVEIRKEAVITAIEDTQLSVIKSQRYSLRPDDPLQSAYDRLEQARVSLAGDGFQVGGEASPSVSFKLYELVSDREGLRDFITIENMIGDIQSQLDASFDTEKYPVEDKLKSLRKKMSDEGYRKASEEVERLINVERDLATADELIDYYSGDGDKQHRGIRSPDAFREFFELIDVPTIFEEKSAMNFEKLADAITNGNDYLEIPLSRIEDREVALAILERWREFHDASMKSNISPNAVMASAASLLETLGFRGVEITPDAKQGSKSQKEYHGTLRMDVPTDAESILLPAFGSATHGNWRLGIYDKLPSMGEISNIESNVTNAGVMIVVVKPVKKSDWSSLARDAMKQGVKALVIDAGIFLYTLANKRFRPLTMMEVAQAFSFSDPYRDFGNNAVPPEMFKGRREEYRVLKSPDSGFLVYGGRRLGKTALLRHFADQEGARDNDLACAYIDIMDAAETKILWEMGSAALKDVFPEPVSDPDKFRARVIAWLEKDSRRQIILLVDECDAFVMTDEEAKFAAIRALSQLMSTTRRRFKVVLAGRQNVLRFGRDLENAPLTHMDSGVLPIGPMINKDVADAETLMTAPLAGLGYHFKESKDVWRILSFCNYYPVLIQLVGQELLKTIRDRVVHGEAINREIDGQLVDEILNSPGTKDEIGKTFKKTLELDGARYELLAYVVADQMIEKTDAGIEDDGMRASEVLEAAAILWPAAFGEGATLDDVSALLEEMEVLGLLRKLRDNRWTLRSRSTLSFIGGRQRVKDGLFEFASKAKPQSLENTAKRRPIQDAGKKGVSFKRSVLTIGQEFEIVRNRTGRPMLIFGHSLAGVERAFSCLKKLQTDKLTFTLMRAKSVQSFRNELNQIRVVQDTSQIFVVDTSRQWDEEWIGQATRTRVIRDGHVGIVFIGGPEHVATWAEVPRDQRHDVEMISLQTWRKSFISALLHHALVDDADERTEEVYNATGGWSEIIEAVVNERVNNKTFVESIAKFEKKLESDHEALVLEMGLSDKWQSAMRHVVSFDRVVADIDMSDLLKLGQDDDVAEMDPDVLIEFSRLLGLIESGPVIKEDARRGASVRYTINPLVVRLLGGDAA
ncbi:MAG: RNaseH domain-containing protein [Rhodospirillales bacterium]